MTDAPPREAAADAFDQHVLAALDAAVADRDVERERNRRGRRIAMLVDRDHHAFHRHAELVRAVLCMMRILA